MENGKYDFYRRPSCFGIDPNRDSTAVILDRYRTVLVQRDIDLCTITGQMLIHCIVHDLIYQMIESL